MNTLVSLWTYLINEYLSWCVTGTTNSITSAELLLLDYRVSKLPVHVASRHQSQCPQTFRLQQFRICIRIRIRIRFRIRIRVFVDSFIRIVVSYYQLAPLGPSSLAVHELQTPRATFSLCIRLQLAELGGWEAGRQGAGGVAVSVLDAVVGSFGLCRIWRMHKRYALRPKTCTILNCEIVWFDSDTSGTTEESL